MDIGEIISDAIKYPASDWKKLIILGVFYLLGFLIIPTFFAIGYVFRALKATIAGFDELPEFDEWGGMFVDGLKVFVVGLVYMIIPLIIIGVGVFTSLEKLLSSPGAFTPYGNVIVTDLTLLQAGLGIIIIGIIVAIIFGLLLTIAIAHMAYNDSEFGAAFRFREILDVISEIGWGKYILWYLAVIIVSCVILFIGSLILGSIPVLGQILVQLLVTPYVTLFLYRAIGLRYAYE
ncbi:DUF4013 domain-containing protein [Methanothermobacter tenebrarum]|uniref:DUF4013 domain-containing protein n=1 Tax=Methanothermobacter tenebrarum TaxID=680118 RepID=A0A328PCN3_9EURY|nr:DUF4013 domain-containing protein [Methanothermobacter tenebrarum]MBC7101391.1 DUF4013 domain-containing protein [Methanobacteriales archaeon]NPV65202.1 DUF4013 domain-containing protein [Methanobacteriaceae archaeon]RAO79570.1 hypothetical protein DPC56_01970 [Methanothermobacter tenebrarum]